MREETKQIRTLKSYVKMAIALTAVVGLSSLVKNVVNQRWATARDKVACIPADIYSSFPMVYRQTAVNPVQNDAFIKTFIQEYIEITQNESYIDYHQQSVGKRYNDFYLKDNLKKAIDMSVGTEKALNMLKLANSVETFRRIKKEEAGWIFLIDDILVFNGTQANGGDVSLKSLGKGYSLAVVRGQFQITYDQTKSPASPKLWGYKEIQLLIKQGVPTFDTNNNPINKSGLFVEWSYTQDIEPNRKEDYDKRNFDFYLKQD